MAWCGDVSPLGSSRPVYCRGTAVLLPFLLIITGRLDPYPLQGWPRGNIGCEKYAALTRGTRERL